MTPQERQLIEELFERLEGLESAPRDREAEAAIAEGLRYAPHAIYPLVQTVLVQDEALKRADARIRDLEDQLDRGGGQPQQGGFLEGMRDKLFGEREQPRGSVPPVRSESAPMGAPPGFRPDAGPYGGPQQQPAGPGGSFLGTAAAAAAGAIGGSMMLQGIRSMFGEKHGAFGALGQPAGGGGTTPWSGGDVPADLARQVKLDDLAGEQKSGGHENESREEGYGLLDTAAADDDDDFEDDFDGDDAGDSDTA